MTMAQARTALKQKSDALAGVKIRRDFRIFSAFEKQMLVSIDLGYRRLGTKVKFKELAEKAKGECPVSKALGAIKANGTLDAIYDQWIAGGGEIPYFQ